MQEENSLNFVSENEERLRLLGEACSNCRACELARDRKNVVFGEGNPRARLFFLGKAPGAREDETGRPFVGRAGEVLDRMLALAGLSRSDIYITGSCKCRPPRNRNPRSTELAACRVWLQKQLEVIRPEIVVCLGLVAAKNMLGYDVKLSEMHGRWIEKDPFRVVPTFHPAAVLRNTVTPELLLSDLLAVASAAKEGR